LPPIFLFFLLLFADPSPSSSNLLQKGLLELRQGDLAAARADLETASHQDSTNAYIWSALAEVYARTHQKELADAAAANAEKNGAKNPVVEHALALYYSHVGDMADAARLEEQFASSPKGDAEAITRAAAWYLASGNDTKALTLARKVSQDSAATFELAQLFLRAQQFSDAAELLTDGLRNHPNDAQLTLALGVARYGQRRFEEAITIFLSVIRIDPTVPQSYLFLSRMLDQAGPHLAEIVAATRKWETVTPENAAAKLALAKALLTQDPGSSEAEPLLRRSLQLDANNWDAHYQLGLLLEKSHQYEAAAKEFQQAISLDKTQPEPHYRLARVYDRLDKHDEAEAERAIHQQLTSGNTSK
jgi:tetratricopeptide (TPR) repeat protein